MLEAIVGISIFIIIKKVFTSAEKAERCDWLEELEILDELEDF